jgi:hypothetical protein
MVSTYFGARPTSDLEMAKQEHLILDGVVQKDWACHACFISFGYYKLAIMPPNRHSASWLPETKTSRTNSLPPNCENHDP